MKRFFTFLLALLSSGTIASHAQFKAAKAVSAGAKAVKAVTLSDAEVEKYVKEYIDWLDAHNPVCEGDDPYAVRLNKIIEPIKGADDLNIKAYRVVDVNAFACADGSIRVFAGLMDIMSDEEILGVIGHEIGHIRLKHTKDSFKKALLTSALRDGVSAAGGTAGKLSDSQMGDLTAAYAGSQFSQRHEFEADEYGYNFLKEHGVNPWAMALSFEKLKHLQDEYGSKSNAIQQLFSTHPDIVNRTKRMSDQASADGFERPEPAAELVAEVIEAE